MFKNYVKKPVVIQAIQYTGDVKAVEEFMNNSEELYVDKNNSSIRIPTLEGYLWCSMNDYVIRGVKGEFYPCKPDIFEQTYSPVEPVEKIGD